MDDTAREQKEPLQGKIRIDLISLFPEYFAGPFDQSIIKQARSKKIVDLRLIQLRDFADNKHNRVDERCYGGGPGMVLMAPPVARAIRSVKTPAAHVVYLSPQGTPLSSAKCRELAKKEHLILLCGHYEGIDQRIIDSDVDEEISIGDYVLTNGCLAAIVLVDAVIRFIPGVLGHEDAASEDSFANGILDWPHYTRPELFEERSVPEVLLSGDHKKIQQWRLAEALKKTKRVRPDLLEQAKKTFNVNEEIRRGCHEQKRAD